MPMPTGAMFRVGLTSDFPCYAALANGSVANLCDKNRVPTATLLYILAKVFSVRTVAPPPNENMHREAHSARIPWPPHVATSRSVVVKHPDFLTITTK